MKIAIIYNRESRAVINLFGTPNREIYGFKTIQRIREALKQGGHQVKTFEGDKNIVKNLEKFMPSVIAGERPGLAFNLSYGIQGKSRYTHIPSILEMLGIPYVGSAPETHAIALNKVVTKMILLQKGLPTPRFVVLEGPEAELSEPLDYPLILKPKAEAVSMGLKIVHHAEELRQGIQDIYEMFNGPILVEEYIGGREINVGLLGNDPIVAFPPVELRFGKGDPIYTYEDKTKTSNRTVEKICPAPLSGKQIALCQSLSVEVFKAIGCYDSARIDFRMDEQNDFHILEINSMASFNPDSSYIYAADRVGLAFPALVNKLVDITTKRYFGAHVPVELKGRESKTRRAIFDLLTAKRDKTEDELKRWTNLMSRTDDPVGVKTAVRMFARRLQRLGFSEATELSNNRTAWTWHTKAGLKDGTLFVVPLDIPKSADAYPMPFDRNPEWLTGEGIASSRAGIASLLRTFDVLQAVKILKSVKAGIFAYGDEGRDMRNSSRLLRLAAQDVRQVIVLTTGFLGGKVIDQQRGLRRYRLVAEGDPLRSGHKSGQEALAWFLRRSTRVSKLTKPDQNLSVSVEEIHSFRFTRLLPHKVDATVIITYLDPKAADQAEQSLKNIFKSNPKSIKFFMEKLVERPPLVRKEANRPLIAKLKRLCREWELPFGVGSSLLPSAAGEIPAEIPVLAGFAPAGRDLYTPTEAVHRGEFLQRTLLLSLLLTED